MYEITASFLGGYFCIGLTYIGAFYASYKLMSFLYYLTHICKTFGLARLGFHLDVMKFGTWAVVTGGTDGIGKAYSEQLAEKGMNIVLISRNADKLKRVSTEIESKYKVQTKTLAIDFTSGCIDEFESVRNGLKRLDIGVLVNNVGMFYKSHRLFHHHDNQEKLFPDIIKCNTVSVTMMTSIVLPEMLKKRRGIVINLSSGSIFSSIPGTAVYSSTKAYIDTFTRSLQVEYESSGVTFQSVLPFMVATNMVKRETSYFVPSATDYVRSSLATIGNESRTTGHIMHELQMILVSSILPKAFMKKMTCQMARALEKSFEQQQKDL